MAVLATVGLFAVVAVVVIVVVVAPSTRKKPVPGPWRSGDIVWNAWKVRSVTTHPEYLRYELAKDASTTGVEIASRAQGSGLATERYAVMPAPGQKPPMPLLEHMRTVLAAFERHPDAPILVRGRPKQPRAWGVGVTPPGLIRE